MFVFEGNAMELGWHHLKGQNIYLRIANRYIMPITLYLLAKFCQFHTMLFGCAFLAVTFTNDLSQQRQTAFRCHRYHVNLPLLVVMPYFSTRHRRNLLPSKSLLLLVNLFLHTSIKK